MSTEDYLDLFFPFDKTDVVKRGVESMWNINNDRIMMALAMIMSDKPMAANMSFQKEYAERYDCMGFPLYAAWGTNDVQLYADGQ